MIIVLTLLFVQFVRQETPSIEEQRPPAARFRQVSAMEFATHELSPYFNSKG
jgi:hypothetical protein